MMLIQFRDSANRRIGNPAEATTRPALGSEVRLNGKPFRVVKHSQYNQSVQREDASGRSLGSASLTDITVEPGGVEVPDFRV